MDFPPAVFTYLGVYLGVFGGVFLITTGIDLGGFCNNFVRRLSLKAYRNLYDELTHDPEVLKELEHIEELNRDEEKRKARRGPGLFAKLFKAMHYAKNESIGS